MYRLGVIALARLAGVPKGTASRWVNGVHVPSPMAAERLAALGIVLEPPPRRIGRWPFPSRNWVAVSLVGPVAARRLAAEWKRPLSASDAQFYERVIAPAIVRRLSEVLELPPPPAEREA